MMYAVHPAIEGLHALRDSLGVIVRPRSRLAATAAIVRACFRSAPPPVAMLRLKACSMPTPALRSFMKFPADKIGLYLDWRTQEVGIAAARSGDEALAEAYSSGDVYHALACSAI